MTSIAGEIFDSLPDHCPGCGLLDKPIESGPSNLMLIWQWMIDSYICIDCNRNYTAWAGTNWKPEMSKDKNGKLVTLAELNKPSCLKNIEAIAKGEKPKYADWINDMNRPNHPGMPGMGPPCPVDH
jgi:transposase-like protein